MPTTTAAALAGRRLATLVSPVGLLLLLVSTGTGCSSLPWRREPRVYVPVQKTAEDQFAYAVNYRKKNDLVLHNKENPARMMEGREAVRQTYEKVVEFFPDDRKATPLAKLEIADMTAGLDGPGVTAPKKDLRRAIKAFQELRDGYPEYEFIQAKTRFDEALCWRKLEDYDKAQALFNEVRETYAASKDEEVKYVAQLAEHQYQKTYIKK